MGAHSSYSLLIARNKLKSEMDNNNNSNSNQEDQVPSAPSTPATPGTPGAPLFGAFKLHQHDHLRSSSSNFRRSLLNSCTNCFSQAHHHHQDWSLEDGTTRSLPPLSCSSLLSPVSLARKVGAEFIGTLILIFAGSATAIVNEKTGGSETLVGLAGSTGLAVMIVILSTGHISGAHLNPAVTISFAALKHFPWKHVPMYIGAQVVASISAAFALKAIFDPMKSGGVTVPSGGDGQAFLLEFIISFILMFVVTAVATDTRAVGELAGIAVGATVMLNILIAGETTGASMNPVRTLGPAIAANNFRSIWVYLTAPIVGALCGAGTYTAVKLPEVEVPGGAEKATTPRSFRR